MNGLLTQDILMMELQGKIPNETSIAFVGIVTKNKNKMEQLQYEDKKMRAKKTTKRDMHCLFNL